MARKIVEVSPYFAFDQATLGTCNLDAFVGAVGRSILRQVMVAVDDDEVRARIEEYIDRG